LNKKIALKVQNTIFRERKITFPSEKWKTKMQNKKKVAKNGISLEARNAVLYMNNLDKIAFL